MPNVYRAVEDGLHTQEEEESSWRTALQLHSTICGSWDEVASGFQGLTGRDTLEPVLRV